MKTQNIIQPLRHHLQPLALAAGVVLASAVAAQADTITHGSTTINMDFVTVGNPGNTADTTGVPNPCGAVAYAYDIGKYEVSASQWLAVIAADSTVGNAGYQTGSKPTGGTTWYEAAKFCNWLTSGSANLGAYDTSASGWGNANASLYTAFPSHNPSDSAMAALLATYGRVYVIPTQNEWYKAAYFDPNHGGAGVPGYWNYPTGSDTAPTAVSSGTSPGTAVMWPQASGPAAVDNAGGLSAYGTMAQAGNVFEWNEALSGTKRGQRGGSWAEDVTLTTSSSAFYDLPLTPETWPTTGFRVAALGAAAPPAGYTSWAGAGDNAFDADANNDGVDNGMAWVLGAANKEANAYSPTSLLPTLDNTDPTYFIFNYNRLKSCPDTTIKVQYCSDLASWFDAVAGADIIINTGSGAGTTDPVEVKIKRTLAVGGKLFARLNVVKTP